MASVFGVLLATCMSGLCLASELEVYVMETPPLTMNSDARRGIVGDIVAEAMRRAGYTPKWVLAPSRRALAVVARAASKDQLIIPLARTPSHEAQYTWVSPVIQVQRAFFTRHRGVHSFYEARMKLKKIGVTRGTAEESILYAKHFREGQITEVGQAESAFRMLLLGRIDAWYGPIAEGQALLKLLDTNNQIQVSLPLGSTYNYLGCSKSCNPFIVARISETLREMDKDGSTQVILDRYGVPD